MVEVFDQTISDKAIEFPMPCYYCGSMIEKASDACYRPVKINQKVTVEKDGKLKTVRKNVYKLRVCHEKCKDFLEQAYTQKLTMESQEMIDRDKCYQKLCEWAQVGNSNGHKKKYSYHITKLDGMRQGRANSKGQNVHITNKGYTFDVIYATMIYCSAEIDRAIQTMEFKNFNHKINVIFKILYKHVESVYQKILKNHEESENLSRLVKEHYENYRGYDFDRDSVVREPNKKVQELINSFFEDDDSKNTDQDKDWEKLFEE